MKIIDWRDEYDMIQKKKWSYCVELKVSHALASKLAMDYSDELASRYCHHSKYPLHVWSSIGSGGNLLLSLTLSRKKFGTLIINNNFHCLSSLILDNKLVAKFDGGTKISGVEIMSVLPLHALTHLERKGILFNMKIRLR